MATATKTAKGIKPRAEEMIGETVTLLGIRATITDVVPDSDWVWRVTLSSINGGGAVEVWEMFIPTDYRTTDGQFAWSL